MKGLKKTKNFVIATVAVLAIVFLSSQVLASSKLTVKRGEILDNDIFLKKGEYTSSVFETDFKFRIVGISWQGDEESKFYLRFYDSEGWSKWYHPEDYLKKDNWYYVTEPVIANEGRKIQYKVKSYSGITKVKLIYLNEFSEFSFRKWKIFDFLFSQASAVTGLNIISRSVWEADEDWRFSGSHKEIWPPKYQRPEKFVIHHTAGSDGGNNPEGTLRGIYYWHAVVLGWGDIGYNYLMDQEGNIYEGRFGGDGVIGAHAYRSKICAKVRFGGEEYEADFNKGTIGIAILGDYENNLELNKKVKNSLTDLIAYKGKEFEIEPEGESYLVDNAYPNIVGHKDLDCTACPGKNLYPKLKVIRMDAQQKYESLGGVVNPIIKATYRRQSEQPVVINAGEEKEFWVEFRNEGNVTWRTYEDDLPYVIPKNSLSDFRASDWESDVKITTLDNPNLAPGETGRFTFSIKAPENCLEASEEFQLVFDDQSLAGTDFKINAEIAGLPYAAVLENRSILQAMFVNDTQTVKMQFRNKGVNTWEKGKIKLNIYDLGDKVSRLYDQSWPEEYGQIDFEEVEVKTDEIATFDFILKAPTELGIFKNIYRLVGENKIVQRESFSVTRIDSPFQAELISHSIPLAVLNYWRFPVVVKFRNSGIAPWNRSLVLNVYDLGKEVSKFQDASWNYQSGQFILKEKEVKPGAIGTFEFILKAPKEKGLYLQILKLGIKENNIVIQDDEFSLLTRVDL